MQNIRGVQIARNIKKKYYVLSRFAVELIASEKKSQYKAVKINQELEVKKLIHLYSYVQTA